MNKVFFILFFLTAIGAGVLIWLLNSMPASVAPTDHASKEESLVIAKPDGIEVKDEAAHGEGHGETPAKAAHDQPVLKIETEPVKAVVFVDGEMKGQTPLELPLKDKEQQVKLEAAGFKEVQREAPAVKAGMDLDTLTWKIVLRAQPGSLAASPRAADTAKNEAHAKTDKAHAKAAPKVEAKAEAKETKPEPKVEAKAEPKVETKAEPKDPPAPTASNDDAPVPAVDNPSNVLFLSGASGPAWVQIQALPGNSRANAEQNIKQYRQALNLNVMGCTVEVKGKGQWIRIITGPFDSKTEAAAMLRTINSRLRDPAFVTGVQECQ